MYVEVFSLDLCLPDLPTFTFHTIPYLPIFPRPPQQSPALHFTFLHLSVPDSRPSSPSSFAYYSFSFLRDLAFTFCLPLSSCLPVLHFSLVNLSPLCPYVQSSNFISLSLLPRLKVHVSYLFFLSLLYLIFSSLLLPYTM